MRLKRLIAAFALLLGLASPAPAQLTVLGAGLGGFVAGGGGGGGGGLAVEGLGSINSSDTIAITTAGTNREVCVGAIHNGTSIASITGGSIIFAQAATANEAGDQVSIWCGLSTAQQTGTTLTVTWTGTPSFKSLAVMAISGINTGAPFDTDSSLPVQVTADGDQVFSTTATDTVVMAAYGCGIGPAPTAGAGWTGVAPLATSFFLLEYQIFSSAQTGTSAATTSCTPSRAVIIAVKS